MRPELVQASGHSGHLSCMYLLEDLLGQPIARIHRLKYIFAASECIYFENFVLIMRDYNFFDKKCRITVFATKKIMIFQ